MRAGICAAAAAAQHTLSPESATVLKHSLTLARRRGHAQITPLHVAATLLSSKTTTTTLLRRACFNSQPNQPSHPLQCRALELCFNVALNRLPANHHHGGGAFVHAQPSLSNALVAALKRAQAHQRRGCIEQQQQQQQQQQPLIAVRVEIEQLILSILDDPSVSRVMREAGFSSPAVKNYLEEDFSNNNNSNNSSVSSVFQCYGGANFGGIYSTPNSPPIQKFVNPRSDFLLLSNAASHEQKNPFLFYHNYSKAAINDDDDDMKVVFEVLLRKRRRNIVIVGDALSMAEGVVEKLMGKVERGDVPDELKSAHFIKFQFSSSVAIKFMKREEVEMRIADLKRKVGSFASNGRVIIYIGDLKWTVDEREGEGFSAGYNSYSPVDHLIEEIGKLVSWYELNSNTKVWLMGTANYQTYMKCQMKQPPLDVQWTLQAVSVPSGGLGLSLSATSPQDSRITLLQNPSQVLDKKCVKEEQDVLTTCPECKSNYEKEADFKLKQKKSFSLHSINKDTENIGSNQLPFWLQPHGTVEKEDDLVQLRRKYNKLCQSLHQGSHNPNNSSSIITNQRYLGRHYFSNSSHLPNKNGNFADSDSFVYSTVKPNQNTGTLPQIRRQQSCHIEFSFSNENSKNQSSEPNLESLKSMDCKELKITLALGIPTSEKITVDAKLCNIIQENVPWQSDTIPLIVEALRDSEANGQEKFLLIQGNDLVGKRRLAIGIARSMFGSSDLVFSINMRKNTSTVTQNCEMVEKALKNHEKLVILVEDVDYADPEFVKFLVDCFETGRFMREGDYGDAIFILAVEGDSSYNKARENMDSVIQMKLIVNESIQDLGMPNLGHKRKPDWDFPIKSKIQRYSEMEEVSSKAIENGNREFTMQLSSNALDLNVMADEDEEKEGKNGELSPVSSDLTREVTIEQQSSLRFLNKIKNRFVFNRISDQDQQARKMFLSNFKRSFQEANGSRNITNFDVEEMVLDGIFEGSGLFLNSLFDQWLKDVFQTSIWMIDTGEGGKVSVRLCLDGKGENCAKVGYMGTCLPKKIQVSLIG